MIITKERKEQYTRLGIDIKKLRPYFIDRAGTLLELLTNYDDVYSKELKAVLNSFIEFQKVDLSEQIEKIVSTPRFYGSADINIIKADLCYIDAEIVNSFVA